MKELKLLFSELQECQLDLLLPCVVAYSCANERARARAAVPCIMAVVLCVHTGNSGPAPVTVLHSSKEIITQIYITERIVPEGLISHQLHN